MRPTPWTYALGAVTLLSLAGMYGLAFVAGAEPLPLAVVVIAAILAVIGAISAMGVSLPLMRPRLRDIVTGAGATAMAMFLTRDMEIPALVTVSLVAIVLGIMVVPTGPLDARAEGAGYTGAFVGLITPSLIIPVSWVIVAGAVSGLLWSVIGPCVFPGVGGRLGLVAFMASSAVYGVATALGDDRTQVLLPQVGGLAHAAMMPIGAAGAIITWVLIQRCGWDFALASGLTSLLVCGVIHMSSMGALAPVLGTAWFGGTMVGLSLPARLPNAAWVIVAGLMYGAYMLRFEGPLEGHVGVIGATGVIAVFVAMGAMRVGSWVTALRARRRTPPTMRVPA